MSILNLILRVVLCLCLGWLIVSIVLGLVLLGLEHTKSYRV